MNPCDSVANTSRKQRPEFSLGALRISFPPGFCWKAFLFCSATLRAGQCVLCTLGASFSSTHQWYGSSHLAGSRGPALRPNREFLRSENFHKWWNCWTCSASAREPGEQVKTSGQQLQIALFRSSALPPFPDSSLLLFVVAGSSAAASAPALHLPCASSEAEPSLWGWEAALPKFLCWLRLVTFSSPQL